MFKGRQGRRCQASAEQTTEPAKSRNGVTRQDKTALTFVMHVTELDRITRSKAVERFAKIPANLVTKLARLGKFLTKIADLKSVGAGQPMPTVSLPSSTTVPPKHSAEDTGAKKGELVTNGVAAADTEVLSHV